jgi:hypothetical protein
MPADPLDKIRDDLLLHIARTIVANGVGTRERVFQSLLGIATFLIPAYPALLKLLGFSIAKNGVAPFLVPVVLWMMTIVICAVWSLPVMQAYDLKNLDGIQSIFAESLKKVTLWSRIAAGSMLVGVLAAAWFIATA